MDPGGPPEDTDEDERQMVWEAHDPERDEHNFVLSQVPMVFPDAGAYEVGLDLEVGDRTQSYRYAFTIERRVIV